MFINIVGNARAGRDETRRQRDVPIPTDLLLSGFENETMPNKDCYFKGKLDFFQISFLFSLSCVHNCDLNLLLSEVQVCV